MSNEWWVRDNGRTLGPYGAAELKQMAQSGRLLADTPVRNGTEAPWTRADRVRGLLPQVSEENTEIAIKPQPRPAARPSPGPDLPAIDTSTSPRPAPAARPAPLSRPPARPAEDEEFSLAPATDLPDFGAPHASQSTPNFSASAPARRPGTKSSRNQPNLDAKKILGIVGGVIGFAVAYAAAQGLFGGSVEAEMKKVETQLNKTLPMQIDHLTRLDKVKVGPGKNFSYLYTVGEGVTPEGLRAMEPDVIRRALDTKEMKPIFDAGVTVWYKYHDASGKKLHEISVKR